MPLLSEIAKAKKINYFLKNIPKDSRILEIGCGEGWVKSYFLKNQYKFYTGIDIKPPADIVGSIKNWKTLGLKKESFDIIIIFEVVEHINCFKECYDLLKKGGELLITTPVPYFDWFCKFLEKVNLNQKRTSKHNCIYIQNITYFKEKKIKKVGMLSQWGIFRK